MLEGATYDWLNELYFQFFRDLFCSTRADIFGSLQNFYAFFLHQQILQEQGKWIDVINFRLNTRIEFNIKNDCNIRNESNTRKLNYFFKTYP